MSYGFRLLILSLIAHGVAAPLFAQGDTGARVSGFYAGALGEGETNIAAGGSVGYRFTPRLGFDFDVLALPDLELDGSGLNGRGVAFLTNFVAEFPSPATWLTPYVQGGGGVANISQSSNLERLDLPERLDLNDRGNPRMPVRGLGIIDRNTVGNVTGLSIRARRSDTSLALSVGGGVDFAIWRGLSVGPNISYVKLFGGFQDLDLTRIGARASYRF